MGSIRPMSAGTHHSGWHAEAGWWEGEGDTQQGCYPKLPALHPLRTRDGEEEGGHVIATGCVRPSSIVDGCLGDRRGCLLLSNVVAQGLGLQSCAIHVSGQMQDQHRDTVHKLQHACLGDDVNGGFVV